MRDCAGRRLSTTIPTPCYGIAGRNGAFYFPSHMVALAGRILFDPVNKGHISGIFIVNFIPIPMEDLPYTHIAVGFLLVF